MSITIQQEINQEINRIITENSQLTWDKFVDEVAGDNEHLVTYRPLLKCISAMDSSFELLVQFNSLRGQFTTSENKMSDILDKANFIDGQDYCIIEVENDKIQETLLFISYNCIKLFVMDKQDAAMSRAMILGEQMYSKYKDYSKAFTKAPSIRTHYMLIEQKKGLGSTIDKYAKALGNPKTVIVAITGSVVTIKKALAEIKKHPENWGDIIIPVTKAMFTSALDDTTRIADYVIEQLVKPYKDAFRMQIKAKKQKELKSPTTSEGWGCVIRSVCMMVSPTNKNVPFTYEDVVQCVKEYYINTLGQKHINSSNFTHTEYLDCITELEAARIENAGRFSAIRANAIYNKQVLDAAKAIARADRAARAAIKKAEADAKPIETTLVSTSNGFETGGSECETETKAEPKLEIIESEDEVEIKVEAKAEKKTSKSEKKTTRTKAPKAEEKAKAPRKSRGNKIELTQEEPKIEPVVETKPKAEPKVDTKAKAPKKSAAKVVEELPDSDSNVEDDAEDDESEGMLSEEDELEEAEEDDEDDEE